MMTRSRRRAHSSAPPPARVGSTRAVKRAGRPLPGREGGGRSCQMGKGVPIWHIHVCVLAIRLQSPPDRTRNPVFPPMQERRPHAADEGGRRQQAPLGARPRPGARAPTCARRL
eukprot:3831239-Prymnesium_polylepis.1